MKNLKAICPNCGEIFLTSYGAYNNHRGQYCGKCSSTISKGESLIKKYLQSKNIDFEMQYRFNDCRTTVPLPFDFYLSQQQICIEYDGEGHFMPIRRGKMSKGDAKMTLHNIKERDKIKDDFCRKNDLRLIRISYHGINDIDKILDMCLFA